MSLETLLEAAEFLESREQAKSTKFSPQNANGDQRRNHGPASVSDDTAAMLAKFAIEGRIRTKSGSGKDKSSDTSPDGSTSSIPDGNFLRAGTREVHNKLEKNRRAHLKECFDFLKKNVPSLEEKRTSNLGILRCSLRYIQNLKRKEREFEVELHKFVHQKIVLQEHLSNLKVDLQQMDIDVDINALAVSHDQDNDSNSTSTATERGTPPPSDYDENDDDEEEAEMLAMETNSPTPKTGRKRKHSYKKVSDSPQPVFALPLPSPIKIPPPPPSSILPSTTLAFIPPTQPRPSISMEPMYTASAASNALIRASLAAATTAAPVSVVSSAPPLTTPLKPSSVVTSDIQLPPKKAMVQNLNGLVKLQQKPQAPQFPAPTPLGQTLGMRPMVTPSSAVALNQPLGQVKKVPVIPITLSLSGPVPSQAMTMLSQLPAGFEVTGGKLVEVGARTRPPVSGFEMSGGKLVARPPVTQILHQTLTQRQALQKQTASNHSQVLSAPLTAAQLRCPPVSQPTFVTMSTTQAAQLGSNPFGSLVVKDGVITVAKPQMTSNLVLSQPTKLLSASSTAPVSAMTFPYYMASLQKITHPVLVTSLMAPAMGIQANTTSSSGTPLTLSSAPLTAIKSDIKIEPAKTQSVIPISYNNSLAVIPNHVNVSNVKPMSNLVTFSVASTPKTVMSINTTNTPSVPMRQVLTPNILPGQLAWPFLTIPRTPIMVSSSSLNHSQPTGTGATLTATSSSHATTPTFVSLANLNQLTQMVAPVTVMSPGMQMTPTAITQAQINGMFATPLLKHLQFPMLQSGQVLGQQVMKPVVVVTVPNVISSSLANNSIVPSSSRR
ncbi:proline-rich protein 36-like [Mya arenaria]|uniref:proline-rich protein 36-like n=1 Tax=Mya arenaria TaxID=6604 RepID=UPI0022E85647|nr:proline-rich protein 36-like [Mya arenaria]